MTKLFITVLMIALAASTSACQASRQSASPGVVKANAQAVRLLGSFKPVEGTSYLIAPINSGKKGESWIKGSYESSNTHNYAFFNTADGSTRALMPTNDYLIASTFSFPEKSQDTKKDPATQWFLYSLVKADTDGDNELTHKDKRTVAISDAGGIGYTEVIENVEEVYGQAMRDTNTMYVIYLSDSKKYAAMIDLPNRKVITTAELPSLGIDVR